MTKQERIEAAKQLLAIAIKERNFEDIDYYNAKLESMTGNK